MISYEEALAILAEQKPAGGAEDVELVAAVGRTLASPLHAQVASPPFTNSAMDGFAFRADEVEAGREIPIIGRMFAQALSPNSIPEHQSGACVQIMTGALVPEWADTVIPVEQTHTKDSTVIFEEIPKKGSHVRYVGEDAQAGQMILPAGAVLTAERVMAAAAFGHATLSVRRRPQLALFSTGDELKMPGEPLPPGAIYNSSRFLLEASARQIDLRPEVVETLADDEMLAKASISHWLDGLHDGPGLMITTGAVSAGTKDFLPQLAQQLGFKELFHKVAIRPGKPVYFAKRDDVYWLGLPGNAVSTCVGWHFFARPLLAAIAGIPEPEKQQLTLKNAVNKPEHLRCFYRAEVNQGRAWVPEHQGSARLMASVTAEAYVILPEGNARVPADSKLSAILL